MLEPIVEKFTHIELNIVNGLQGDPAVYAFFYKSGDGVLFDAGNLENLSHKDLLRVRHVAITHTHIDHFIGFDRLIRVNIPHFREITVSGPTGIAKNVQAKLHAYLWNLLDPGQIRYRVIEVSKDSSVRAFMLSSDTQFALEEIPAPNEDPAPGITPVKKPVVHVNTLADGTRIEAVPLDHGTAVLGYSCQMPRRYQVLPGALESLGIKEGPWIGELQKALGGQDIPEYFKIGSEIFVTTELAGRLFKTSAPRVLGYVTDIGLSEDNLCRLTALMPHVDTLVCESSFCEADFEKAFSKKHLTTKHAAIIAAKCHASALRTFHISNIYAQRVEEVRDEGKRLFVEVNAIPAHQLDKFISTELSHKF